MPERDWAAMDGVFGKMVPPVRMHLANAVRSVAYHTGLHRALFYRYDYMFRPQHLAFLVQSLTDTHELPGPILEIGCAAGHSTVFLNKHLDDLDDPRQYVCIDTFAGFTDPDIAVEVDRGHESKLYEFLFRAYRKEWFDQTMRNNNVSRVRSIEADVNTFDFRPYRDISFCLVDVDLERPVATALAGVFPRMAAGGIVVVDDCTPGLKFEGAYSAYVEFVEKIGAPVDVRFDRLGIIRVPDTAAGARTARPSKHSAAVSR
jgi:predicted O-methyltransferase YrrM